MRLAATLFCLLTSNLCGSLVHAQPKQDNQYLSIAIVAPFDGPYAVLAKQIRLGVEAASLQNHYPVNFIHLPEFCNAEKDAVTAEKIRQSKIKIVIGYLCSESLEGAAPVLSRDGIPVLSLGSRQLNILEQQSKQHFGTFRLQAERNAAINVLVDELSPTWRTVPFALLEDGTVQGRDFARQVLQAFKARGLEPALTDTYRPAQPSQSALIAQLKRAGIHHVLLGGEGDDASVIARSAASSGFPLTIAGSETLLRSDPLNPLPVGLLMSAIPQNFATAEPAIKAINDLANNDTATQDIEAGTYALLAYSALQIAHDTLVTKTDPQQSLTAALQNTHYDTATGSVSFTPQGLRRETPYRLMRFNGQKFELVE